jgi:hypothetical protein
VGGESHDLASVAAAPPLIWTKKSTASTIGKEEKGKQNRIRKRREMHAEEEVTFLEQNLTEGLMSKRGTRYGEVTVFMSIDGRRRRGWELEQRKRK